MFRISNPLGSWGDVRGIDESAYFILATLVGRRYGWNVQQEDSRSAIVEDGDSIFHLGRSNPSLCHSQMTAQTICLANES
jgi:hypothetical protein